MTVVDRLDVAADERNRATWQALARPRPERESLLGNRHPALEIAALSLSQRRFSR